MGWLRSLLGRSSRSLPAVEAAALDLALSEPAGHTWALVVTAEGPASPEYDRAVAALEDWPPRRWLGLDAVRLDARTEYVEHTPRGGWSAAIEQAGASSLLLVLASTHRDGFLRERTIPLLAERTGALTSAALALRTTDHVSEVREPARPALAGRTSCSDAAVIVPILLAVEGRKVAAGFVADYLTRLSGETLRSLVRSQDNETRRLAVERAPLTSTELVEIAVADRDLHARLGAARRAIAQDVAVAGELFAVRPASVRALAVAAAPDELVRPRLEQLLLDRSALLRRAAQARATTLEVDAAAVYRRHLPARTAVLGLGETGSDADVDRLVELVDERQEPAVRRAAVRALGWRAPSELLLVLLPPLLEADQPGVAREAGRQLRRLGFTLSGTALDRLVGSPHAWTRQAALGIARSRPGWDAPVAALALYDDPNESVREYARSALHEWFGRKASSAGVPTREQADRLSASLDRVGLSPWFDRQLRFHAGL